MDRHVVRVHDTVYETHTHPVCDHDRCLRCNLIEPSDKTRIIGHRMFGEVLLHRVIYQLFKGRFVTVHRMNLKRAKSYEALCDSTNNCTCFRCRISVVHDISNNILSCRNQRKSTSCRDSKMVHSFTAKELTYGRSQNCLSICKS